MQDLRILFFGMNSTFSYIPFDILLNAGLQVCGLVLAPPATFAPSPAPIRSLLPSQRPQHVLLPAGSVYTPTVLSRAWKAGIPVWEVRQPNALATLDTLAGLEPDLICVVCFPYLLPKVIVDLPKHGALNLHPSLLPAYRGPDPLFWIFHDGLELAGVTIHYLDQQADNGDIVAQIPVVLPDGVSYSQAEAICANAGGALLVSVLQAIHAGNAQRQPQMAATTPYARRPKKGDFDIMPDWSVRRAYNFIQGMVKRGPE